MRTKDSKKDSKKEKADADAEMCNELKDRSNMNLQRKDRLAARPTGWTFGFSNPAILASCYFVRCMKQ
jgi:hypothetical protein